MFVKFTKRDGSPVWINADYVVTVEPLRSGGALVVPIGDGLDYEVREDASAAVSLVENGRSGAPVVAIQNSDPLAPRREKAKPRQPAAAPAPATAPAPAPTPAATATVQTAEKQEAATAAAAPKPVFDGAEGAEGVPESAMVNAAAAAVAIKKELAKSSTAARTAKTATARKTRKTAAAKTAAEAEAEPQAAAAEKTDAAAENAPAPELDLDDEQIGRLRTMSPRTVKKILNSLKAQFDVKDPDATVRALAAHGIISIGETGRVSWCDA